MQVSNINNSYFLKENDTATQIRLLVTDDEGNPFPLRTAARVEVVIGVPEGRILAKEATLLAGEGELEFGLDEGDLVPVGDNRLEVHVIMPNNERHVAPSKGFYKLRVQEAIDELNVQVTTYTLQYFLDEVNRITAGLPEVIATAEQLTEQMQVDLTQVAQLKTDAQTALDDAEATEVIVDGLAADMQNVKTAAETATTNANTAADNANSATNAANTATTNANNATEAANNATNAANTATANAIQATTNATKAYNDIQQVLPNVQNLENVESWNSTTQYHKNNIVEFNGSSFMALQDSLGQQPPTLPTKQNEYWSLLAQRGVDGTGAVSTVNGISPDVNGNVLLTASDVGAYVKPTDGIPSTDLDSSVQSSLEKANTALQNVPDASTSSKGIVQLNDTLTSTSTTEALTANQGKVLDDKINVLTQDVDEIDTNLTTLQNEVTEQLAETKTDLEQRAYNVRWNALLVSNGDWTNAINTAITTCSQAEPQMKLEIPPGVYDIAGNIINPDCITIEGVYNAYSSKGIPLPSTRGLKGTVLRDTSVGNLEPMIKVGSADTFLQGFRMNNIYLHSDGNTERRALYLQNCGWSLHLENVFVNGFKGGGVTFDATYDGTIRGLDVVNCGGKLTDNSIQYAVEFVNTLNEWDVQNALHIFGMHIEFCRYSLKLDGARHNQFIGCKVENIETTANTDYTNPYISITPKSMENTFDACMFVMPSVKEYIDYVQTTFGATITPNDVPYYITTGQNTDSTSYNEYRQLTKFIGCDFTTSQRGSKVIKAEGKVLITGCYFDFIAGSVDGAIDLRNKSKIADSYIVVNVGADGLSNGIKLRNSDLDNVTIELAVDIGVATVQGNYPVLAYENSLVRALRLIGDWTYSILNADNVTTNKFFEKTVNKQTFNSSNITSLSASPNYSSFSLDLNKVKSSFVAFNLSQALTISNITPQFDGQEVIIYNDSANTITITKSATMRFHDNPTSVVLESGDHIVLKWLNWCWFGTPFNYA